VTRKPKADRKRGRVYKSVARVFTPGETVAGAVVMASELGERDLRLRCQGHGGTCQTAFTESRWRVYYAIRCGRTLGCPACDQGLPPIPRTYAGSVALERLLEAAWTTGGDGPWEVGEFVLAAWTLDPERYGLKGFTRRYPSSNRVICEICRKKGGSKFWSWIERLGPNRYQLVPPAATYCELRFGRPAAHVLREKFRWLSEEPGPVRVPVPPPPSPPPTPSANGHARTKKTPASSRRLSAAST
jgi:hypothetical protein